MIRAVLTDAPYDAITLTVPKAQDGGPCSAIGTNASFKSRERSSTA
jgi:hypothetical protein